MRGKKVFVAASHLLLQFVPHGARDDEVAGSSLAGGSFVDRLTFKLKGLRGVYATRQENHCS
jgi:hypothetical protein